LCPWLAVGWFGEASNFNVHRCEVREHGLDMATPFIVLLGDATTTNSTVGLQVDLCIFFVRLC
jgi:hypothetical protein